MAKKSPSDDLAPTQKRQILEEKILRYKAQAYNFLIEAEAAKVQEASNTSEAVRELRKRSDNAAAGARRLQELLDELPEPEADPEDAS